jgi:cytochrome c peroxidase
MWDGGIVDMDLQAIAPITNHVEMDETMDHVLQKLRKSVSYPGLFKTVYGSEEITTGRFLKSISQFMAMCISSNSKYDSVIRKQGPVFTSDELDGYNIIKQNCTPCHQEPLFTDYSFRNNGIAASGVNDLGRYLITEKEDDRYKFKVPSLRNLAYTAPYMHDGRFFTIGAVLDHYTDGVHGSPTLDSLFQKNEQLGIKLSIDDKIKVTAFLATLNDKAFIIDKRFSEQ